MIGLFVVLTKILTFDFYHNDFLLFEDLF